MLKSVALAIAALAVPTATATKFYSPSWATQTSSKDKHAAQQAHDPFNNNFGSYFQFADPFQLPKQNKANIAYLAYQNKLLFAALAKTEEKVAELDTKVQGLEATLTATAATAAANEAQITLNTGAISASGQQIG